MAASPSCTSPASKHHVVLHIQQEEYVVGAPAGQRYQSVCVFSNRPAFISALIGYGSGRVAALQRAFNVTIQFDKCTGGDVRTFALQARLARLLAPLQTLLEEAVAAWNGAPRAAQASEAVARLLAARGLISAADRHECLRYRGLEDASGLAFLGTERVEAVLRASLLPALRRGCGVAASVQRVSGEVLLRFKGGAAEEVSRAEAWLRALRLDERLLHEALDHLELVSTQLQARPIARPIAQQTHPCGEKQEQQQEHEREPRAGADDEAISPHAELFTGNMRVLDYARLIRERPELQIAQETAVFSGAAPPSAPTNSPAAAEEGRVRRAPRDEDGRVYVTPAADALEVLELRDLELQACAKRQKMALCADFAAFCPTRHGELAGKLGALLELLEQRSATLRDIEALRLHLGSVAL